MSAGTSSTTCRCRTPAPEIAHLLIGPGGVFVVTPALHRGKKVYVSGETTLVNGFRHYHTRTSRSLAARVAQELTRSVGFDVEVIASSPSSA